jgi:hypothetical protein
VNHPRKKDDRWTRKDQTDAGHQKKRKIVIVIVDCLTVWDCGFPFTDRDDTW